MISEKLLKLICCPACKGELKQSDDGKYLICHRCKLKYPVIDDIPVLLVDEAIKYDESSN